MLTIAQAADRLKVSRDCVTRAIQAGRLIAFDFGTRGRHCYRISDDAIAAYLESVRVKPAPKRARKKPLQVKGRWFD